jgi:hypothetical protein
MKQTIMTGALILGTLAGLTSATLAQGYYGGRYEGGYGYQGGYGRHDGPTVPDVDRGGPGPRVQGGSGAGVGAER